MPDGSVREVPIAERASRLAIDLVDIKHTHEQAVGKTHLIELLYYGVAMSTMLREGLAPLAAAGHFRMLSPAGAVTGLTSIKPEHIGCQDVANELMAKGKLRTRVVREGGLDANRFSCHIYTSASDVQGFLDTAKKVFL